MSKTDPLRLRLMSSFGAGLAAVGCVLPGLVLLQWLWTFVGSPETVWFPLGILLSTPLLLVLVFHLAFVARFRGLRWFDGQPLQRPERAHSGGRAS